jgi:hypothetical protein
LETEIADAEKQAQWENRYYNERDYGGRLWERNLIIRL